MSSSLLFQDKPSSSIQPKLSSQQYSHLTVKQIKQSIGQFNIDYYTPIQTNFKPLNKTANKIQQLMHDQNLKQQMIYSLVSQIRQKDPQYKRLKQMIKQQLIQKGYNISQMQSRRKTFAIDCFREVMSYPFKQPHQQQDEIMGYNFLAFWRLCLQKQLRRVLWQKSLINQQTKQQFFTYDHELTPYNIQTEFRLTIQRIAQKQGIRLKQLQKDLAIKLLQYTVKRTQTLPNRSQVYMALNVVQLFSYYNINRVNEIGAVYCGLQSLAQYYYQPNVDKRIQRIIKVIQYVDVITYQILHDYFFSNTKRSQQARMQLNEIYQHFRLSLTSRYLPLSSSQYIIDQLLIKKRTVIDMYVMFGIVILVLGDHIEKLLDQGNQFMMVSNNNSSVVMGMNNNTSKDNKDNLKKPGDNLPMSSPIKNNDNKDISNSFVNNNSCLINNNQNTNNTKQLQKSPLRQKFQSSPYKMQQSTLISDTLTGVTLKQIFQSSKQIIKLEQIVQAFNVVFQKIPASFSSQHKLSQTNRLFKYMLEVEKQAKEKGKSKSKYQQKSSKNKDNIGQSNKVDQLDEQQRLIKQLQQVKKQQSKPIGTSLNSYNGFVVVKNDKMNYQRLGRRK